ncbi:MAG TPA: polymer-forming cytoskeletal protein [Methylomirabilota bacterium]|jgi:cytoskeletal protein CcmA (bactofilin family)
MKALRRLLGLAERRFGLDLGTTTVIGEGVTLKGEMRGSGPIVVLGRFEGDIAVEGTITVGEGGYVDANISAGTIVIDGDVRGNLSADTNVEIGATGSLTGSVKSAAMSASSGATVKSEIWLERAAKPEATS